MHHFLSLSRPIVIQHQSTLYQQSHFYIITTTVHMCHCHLQEIHTSYNNILEPPAAFTRDVTNIVMIACISFSSSNVMALFFSKRVDPAFSFYGCRDTGSSSHAYALDPHSNKLGRSCLDLKSETIFIVLLPNAIV